MVCFFQNRINLASTQVSPKISKLDGDMDEKKDGSKILELSKLNSRPDSLKRSFLNLKNGKAKTSVKKVGRSRTQKGNKNY